MIQKSRMTSRSVAPIALILLLPVFLVNCGGELSTADLTAPMAHPFANVPVESSRNLTAEQLDAPPAERGALKSGDLPANLFDNLKALNDYVEAQRRNKSKNKNVGTIGVFGGFGTCSSYGPASAHIYKRMIKLLWERAAEGRFYRLVATCFARSRKYIYYVSSSDIENVRWGLPEDISKIVNFEATKASTQDVYLSGHSYGGWLAMRAAVDLPEKVKIKGLATIDPISRNFCTPKVMIKAYFSSIASFNPDPDCTRAPRDFTSRDTSFIKSRVDWWHNFYQANSGFLHSGFISGAINKYVDFDYTGVFELAKAHMQIDNDVRVWSEFDLKIF